MRVIGVRPDIRPATLVYGGAYYTHTGGGTPGTGTWAPSGLATHAPGGTDPRYYLDNRSALWPVAADDGTHLRPVNVYRAANGVAWQIYDPPVDFAPGGGNFGPPEGQICLHYTYTDNCATPWTGDPGADNPNNYVGPLSDTASADCNPTAFSCFGNDPSRYETMRVANNLRGPDDQDGYVLGRLSDGLHVYAYDGRSWDRSLPVLTALKDSASGAPPAGTWSSIRTGDITGDGHTDVVALVVGQLKVWELKPDASGGWVWGELPAEVPLNLGSSYETDASYYSTIQVGPIAGPGYPDGVIARGPFGVRTWFYCSGGASPVPGCASLQGKSGWTSFRAQGAASYPQFTGGQAAAWTALNKLAHDPPPPSQPLISPKETTVRDVWTRANPPSTDQLSGLSNSIAFVAGCSVQNETSVNPPTYSDCKPPVTGAFTAGDWTAVINTTLADIYAAQQVLTYYNNLGNLRRDTFPAEGAELPAISDQVLSALQGAAGNSAELSTQSLYSTGIGIAGSIAGLFAPELSVALSVASYVIGAIPSASPDADAPPALQTMSTLRDQLAKAIPEADAAQAEQSYEVRQDWGCYASSED